MGTQWCYLDQMEAGKDIVTPVASLEQLPGNLGSVDSHAAGLVRSLLSSQLSEAPWLGHRLEKVVRYCDTFHINELIRDITEAVFLHRPDDLVEFMISCLEEVGDLRYYGQRTPPFLRPYPPPNNGPYPHEDLPRSELPPHPTTSRFDFLTSAPGHLLYVDPAKGLSAKQRRILEERGHLEPEPGSYDKDLASQLQYVGHYDDDDYSLGHESDGAVTPGPSSSLAGAGAENKKMEVVQLNQK